MLKNLLSKPFSALLMVCVLSACSFNAESDLVEDSSYTDEQSDDFFDEPKDPLDDFNRAMMELNFFLDDYILKPAATVYKALTPEFIQTGVGNFTEYARLPFYMVNDVLQLRGARFAQNFWVFTVNTFGGLGTLNLAGQFQVYATPNDFGMTLHTWGAGAGQDITLPFLGPSCLRDVVGSIVGFVGDPVGIVAYYHDYSNVSCAISGVGLVHSRSLYLGQLESLRMESYDPYATLKSIAKQKREADLKGLE